MARRCDHCGQPLTRGDAPVELSLSSRAPGERWQVRLMTDFHPACVRAAWEALLRAWPHVARPVARATADEWLGAGAQRAD